MSGLFIYYQLFTSKVLSQLNAYIDSFVLGTLPSDFSVLFPFDLKNRMDLKHRNLAAAARFRTRSIAAMLRVSEARNMIFF